MNVMCCLEGLRNIRFAKRRFVVVGVPSLGIEGLEGLSPIKQPERPVVAVEASRPRRPLPSRAVVTMAAGIPLPPSPGSTDSITSSPTVNCDTPFEEPGSSSMIDLQANVLLMNVRPRVEALLEERSITLPEDNERLRALMEQVRLRRMDEWYGRVYWRVDAGQWELQFQVPLELEEGDRIVGALTDDHDDLLLRSASPASYHGEILDFDQSEE